MSNFSFIVCSLKHFFYNFHYIPRTIHLASNQLLQQCSIRSAIHLPQWQTGSTIPKVVYSQKWVLPLKMTTLQLLQSIKLWKNSCSNPRLTMPNPRRTQPHAVWRAWKNFFSFPVQNNKISKHIASVGTICTLKGVQKWKFRPLKLINIYANCAVCVI